ncbi:MaoC family dehydratase N-terminal domain-containing protein [Saccharopolyspora sp. WRP15-2]|uniref:MaoC family dehydratase N-terminal domain-containing protein n=1 Tax=Saccharopolyspora oryzae TaxID=2997343 RepID=A0ABT4UQU8_9PSEU|nr:MaoC family dehydratase N-terminal domain-containing protein [Saccharopolyspora oryzae]MDA3624095.1 MaoC family dehydratase N-terminal domain-containing protein [Saccharopolyspora oryzae]
MTTLAKLFDDGTPAPGTGDALPPLWHWVALPRWPVSSELALDGHPARGAFLPPIELPRRMFAGGEVTFHADVRIGEVVRRESTVESVSEKSGRSGKLVIVVVRTRLFGANGRLAIEERQDLIYREAAAPSAPTARADVAAELHPVGRPLRRTGEWAWDFATDPSLLMRFSAATANAHRIHYDWPYATVVEGYPGLVVHGPLMTLTLAEVLRLEQPPGRPTRFTHRNRAPLFCGQAAKLHGEPTADGFSLDLLGPGGESAGPRTSLVAEFGREGESAV